MFRVRKIDVHLCMNMILQRTVLSLFVDLTTTVFFKFIDWLIMPSKKMQCEVFKYLVLSETVNWFDIIDRKIC